MFGAFIEATQDYIDSIQKAQQLKEEKLSSSDTNQEPTTVINSPLVSPIMNSGASTPVPTIVSNPYQPPQPPTINYNNNYWRLFHGSPTVAWNPNINNTITIV